MKLQVYKSKFVTILKSKISENESAYINGDFKWTVSQENEENLREIDAPWLDQSEIQKLNSVFSGNDDVDDPRDALILFNALKELPPEHAKDERIWTTLCHVHCLEYVRARNYKFITASDEESRRKIIGNRFFMTDLGRGAERTNSLSRLWWYGYCVDQVALELGVSLSDALDVQLKDTDFRANTIERPEVMSSKRMRAAVIANALKHVDADEGQFWSSRNNRPYRPVMRTITERATRIFFPAIAQNELNDMVDLLVDNQKTHAQP